MKPRLTLKLEPQFQIPTPFVAWCHYCNVGFMSIDECSKHDREKINEHQRIK